MSNWRTILSWKVSLWIATVEDQWQINPNPRRYKVTADTPFEAAQKAAIKEGQHAEDVVVLNKEENAFEVPDALVIQVSDIGDMEEAS